MIVRKIVDHHRRSSDLQDQIEIMKERCLGFWNRFKMIPIFCNVNTGDKSWVIPENLASQHGMVHFNLSKAKKNKNEELKDEMHAHLLFLIASTFLLIVNDFWNIQGFPFFLRDHANT